MRAGLHDPVLSTPPSLTLQKQEIRVKGRKVREVEGHYELRESEATYNTYSTPENGPLSVENTFYLGGLSE